MIAIVFFESADSSRADCLRFSRTTDPIIARDCRGSYDFAIFFFFSYLKCVLSLDRSYDVRAFQRCRFLFQEKCSSSGF